MPQNFEKIAARALLRHYWRKGMDAPAAVFAICAVEGEEWVGLAEARHWFDKFERGHTDLEGSDGREKAIWLPSESLLDILRFVPFTRLHQHIALVGRRFFALADPLLCQLCPRMAKPLKICWDSEENLRRFERGMELDGFNVGIAEDLEALENGNLLCWEWDPVPNCGPPPNIIGFRRLIIQGHLDRDLLAMLTQISAKIGECQLDFNDVGQFIDAVKWNRLVRLDDFFAALPRPSHMVLYRHVTPEFLAHPYILGCPHLEIHWVEFEAEPLLNWLRAPVADGQPTMTKSLTIFGYYSGPAESEPVNLLLGTLISEYRESSVLSPRGFVLELRDFEGMHLAEFEDAERGLSLAGTGGGTGWRLAKRGAEPDNPEESGTGGVGSGTMTQIEIGRFFTDGNCSSV